MRYRPMQPGDVHEAAEIIAQHPIIGPRYGSAISDLPAAWLRILASDAVNTFVLQAEEGENAPLCGLSVTVIVNDDFVREIKTSPLFWVGPELTRRILSGRSPLLTEKQLQDANSQGGLNLLSWEGCPRHQFEFDPEIFRCAMDAFIQTNLGYLWKEAISTQAESGGRLQWSMKTGGWFWDPAAGCYVESLNGDADAIARNPHIVGVTRKDLVENSWSSAGSWVGRLFDYHPPILGFTRGEQRVLTLALTGATDEQLSAKLNIAVPTIKKTWVSIYHRVADHLPHLVSDVLQSDIGGAARGREKRRDLLAYLREHPEELRPVSRKLL